jgi:hypothetical protein
MYHVTFPPQSNRASWVFIGLITDLADQPIDITGCTLVFSAHNLEGIGYLSASTDDGKITIIDVGRFRWFFPLEDMRGLRPGTYDTGLTLMSADGEQTIQLSVGPLPIVDGIVP